MEGGKEGATGQKDHPHRGKRENGGRSSTSSAKNICAPSWGIVCHRGIGVSQVSPWCLLVSPSVIGTSSFPPGRQFSKCADAARYAPDLPGFHRIQAIPNNHFLSFFPDDVGWGSDGVGKVVSFVIDNWPIGKQEICQPMVVRVPRLWFIGINWRRRLRALPRCPLYLYYQFTPFFLLCVCPDLIFFICLVRYPLYYICYCSPSNLLVGFHQQATFPGYFRCIVHPRIFKFAFSYIALA